jgi:hypothetical protein
MFAKSNDMLINEITNMLRRNLRHFADMEMNGPNTESARRRMLLDEVVAHANELSDEAYAEGNA